MAKYATKAKENIFTQARYNAAKFNDRLNSRGSVRGAWN